MMSDSSISYKRFGQLLDALVEGIITDGERDELMRHLHTDPAARAEYAAHVALHALLKLEHASPIVPAEPLSGSLEPIALLPQHSGLGFVERATTVLRRPVVWSTLAASIMFVGYVALISWGMLGKDNTDHDP
jgi:anti-sigma factor RsiW